MLFLGEVRRLETAPLGFDPTNIVAGMALAPEPGEGGGIVRTQTTRQRMEQLALAMQERVTALSGDQGFALASAVPRPKDMPCAAAAPRRSVAGCAIDR